MTEASKKPVDLMAALRKRLEDIKAESATRKAEDPEAHGVSSLSGTVCRCGQALDRCLVIRARAEARRFLS